MLSKDNKSLKDQIVLKNMFHLLSFDEINEVLKELGKEETLKGETRGFTISKIQDNLSFNDLKNEKIMKILFLKTNEILEFIEASLTQLDKSDLIKIYEKSN